jgi:general secretion pathway protein G
MPTRGTTPVASIPTAQAGVTILEMLITLSLLFILAAVSMPVAKMATKRSQELELRQKLREMRLAIDQFRQDWARDGDTLLGAMCKDNKLSCKQNTGLTGYPKKLTTLLGIELTSEEAAVKEKKASAIPIKRYLRRLPIDPMTGRAEWGLRCYADPPDTDKWCEEDVYDVYSMSPDLAIDNTRYRDW